MIKVKIGAQSKDLEDVKPSWINQQIHGMRDDGLEPCVQVRIETPDVHLTLVTQNCAGSAGGNRNFNHTELSLIELWRDSKAHGTLQRIEHVIGFSSKTSKKCLSKASQNEVRRIK